MKSALWLCFFVGLTIATRCHNFADIFVNGHVYFVDADCYSRMTRVRMVIAHPLAIIHHHDFENWPQGIAAHTTMPMDWLIAAMALALKPFSKQCVDLAGAFVSPLLGVLTTAFLWLWARCLRVRFAGAMLMLASASPILVHGTLMGRPDHQSLLIFLMAVAMSAEIFLIRESSRAWSIVCGTAWGLGLWISLYEPLVLSATVAVVQAAFFRAKFFSRERLPGFIAMGAILAFALLIEGWQMQLPDATMREFFPAWAKTIGELRHVSLFSATLWNWCGLALIVAPLVLAVRVRAARESALLLALLAVSFGFTLNQQRWGYFLALVCAMSLPWVLPIFRKGWIAWMLFALSLWPVASYWDETIFPDEKHAAQIAERRDDNEQLRDIASQLALAPHGGVLAPWWFSPALAYWSGQPCVAGSSHESLPGIVDAARFYLTDTGGEEMSGALKILRERQVRWLIAYDSARVAGQSAELLSKAPPLVSMARLLDERPHSAPPFLKMRYANRAFKIFEVESNLTP